MLTKAILSQTDAIRVLDAAQQEADRQGWNVTVAITDDGGHLLALRRLDGTAPFTAEAATHKARTAAVGRRETEFFEDMINHGRTAFVTVPLKGLLSGGVPIVVEGDVVGAVGVSGVKPDQDALIAKAAIRALES
ncbi:heme-binding protein [Halomonas piscis]|uniref:Heme-binding protein n=1 Tax=Halomonas piscis TaxID=3031727 RepID=A0ABY9Z049_9GAMM|nr:heme-binding protein [Halomonas piscis]WNK19633.1 heme-binding protein [Halomonas piscis]